MRQLRLEKRKAWPSMWALIFLAVCCGLSLVVTFRASAQSPQGAPAAPAASKPSAPAKASKPEESATIPDDPTLVPDDKESADNNVTFPVDI